jgi:SAM-dependent methyltransferase
MPSSHLDSTNRFSNRVEDYIKYRPGYPSQVLDILREETGFDSTSIVADVGSGTGISCELFLKNGNAVFGVEPNAPMRAAAESMLARYPQFHSIAGAAEDIPLPPQCVDYIVAAQAFHWFDSGRAKTEFRRVLRPNGWLVLLWNSRRNDSTPFLREYEALLQDFAIDYQQVMHRNLSPSDLARFFAPASLRSRSIYNEQEFDFDGLKGRLLSSSYAPLQSHPNHDRMLAELRRIFDEHAVNDRVRFEYDLEIYAGHVE